jgi:hypothetical protein
VDWRISQAMLVFEKAFGVDVTISQAILDFEKAFGVDVTIPQALTSFANYYPNPTSESLSHSIATDDGE